jgi:hypothetical protein
MSDNPFLDADEDENSTPEGADGNQNFKQLRSYARKQEQLAKQLQAENLALKTRVTESAFKEAGLSEKHASLFAKVHEGDVTPEAVIQFATEYELPRREAPAVIAEDGAATPAPATDDGAILDLSTGEVTKPPGFAPAQASGAAPAGKIITDAQEAQSLYVTNPAEYIRLHEQGRIQLSKLPGAK